MFSFGKTKKHTHLTEFLLEKSEVPQEEIRYYGVISAVVTICLLLGLGVAALTKAMGVPILGAVASGLGIAFAANGAVMLGARRILNSLKPKFSDIELQGRKMIREMKTSLDENRLKRDAHPAILELLDAAAVDWKRVQACLKSPFWTRSDLPEHWVRVREQAKLSADRTMFELLVMLRTGFQPDRKEHLTWQEGVTRALEQVGLMETTSSVGIMPAEIEPAYELSLRLKELAYEIEETSANVARTEIGGEGVRFTADRDIRDTLSELRHIREAEQEIERELDR